MAQLSLGHVTDLRLPKFIRPVSQQTRRGGRLGSCPGQSQTRRRAASRPSPHLCKPGSSSRSFALCHRQGARSSRHQDDGAVRPPSRPKRSRFGEKRFGLAGYAPRGLNSSAHVPTAEPQGARCGAFLGEGYASPSVAARPPSELP